MMPTSDGHDREVFADGNMAEVIRSGSSVFRSRGPWSDASQQVLRHLESCDVRWAPRLLSVTDDQEELSFIHGESIPAGLEGYGDEGYLVQTGELIRELHGAMAGFRFTAGTRYVPMRYGPVPATMICHQDIGPWNVIVENGRINGLVDWDLVGPATAAWDLAYAAWRFAPLYPEDRTQFSPAEQARRISVLLDAYALSRADRAGFVELILQRMRSAIDTVDKLGLAGVPGFSRLYEDGLHLSGHDDIAWLHAHRAEINRGGDMFLHNISL